MSTEVKARPNIPAALEALVYQALGEASIQWDYPERAGVFKSEKAAAIAEQLHRQIEKAWDEREAPLHAHLQNLSYNLAQLEKLGLSMATGNLEACRRAVDNVIGMLEQGR